MSPAQPNPESASWSLAADVHAAAVGEDLVLLDVRSDAYYCVPGGAAVGTFDVGRRRLLADAAGLMEPLSTAGLIEASKSPPPARDLLCPAPGRTARSPAQPPRLGWPDLLDAAGCLLDLLFTYRGRSLAELLQRARASATAGPPRLTPDLLAIVARFRQWAPFAPAPGKCLLRAYMLLRLLRRKGHDARWVFGVATWPFAAHCWLQVGDVVLDDEVERLAIYRTILVV